MEGFLNLKEKINRLRFLIDKIRYKREKNLYLALFFLVCIICVISVSVFLYQKKQISVRENILSGYFKDELKMEKETGSNVKDINIADNAAQESGYSIEENMENPGSSTDEGGSSNKDNDTENHVSLKEAPEKIKVYICGSVNNPGVYEIAGGSRVADLIEICGGPNEDAALEVVNLASILMDAGMIYIPSLEEIKENDIFLYYFNQEAFSIDSPGLYPGSPEADQKEITANVNINTATIEELTLLPGIGEKTAGSIIDYRTNFGPFKTIEELKNVKGIGDKKFEAVKDSISV